MDQFGLPTHAHFQSGPGAVSWSHSGSPALHDFGFSRSNFESAPVSALPYGSLSSNVMPTAVPANSFTPAFMSLADQAYLASALGGAPLGDYAPVSISATPGTPSFSAAAALGNASSSTASTAAALGSFQHSPATTPQQMPVPQQQAQSHLQQHFHQPPHQQPQHQQPQQQQQQQQPHQHQQHHQQPQSHQHAASDSPPTAPPTPIINLQSNLASTPPAPSVLMIKHQPDPWQLVHYKIHPDPEVVCCLPVTEPLAIEVTLMRFLPGPQVGSLAYYEGASLDDDGFPTSLQPKQREGARPSYDFMAYDLRGKEMEEVVPAFEARCQTKAMLEPQAEDAATSHPGSVRYRLNLLLMKDIKPKERRKKTVPIKVEGKAPVNKAKKLLENKLESDEYCLRFRTDPVPSLDGRRFEAFSAPFHLVCVTRDMPAKFQKRRPRHKDKPEPADEEDISSPSELGKRLRSSNGDPRPAAETESVFRVLVRETSKLLPDVSLPINATFCQLRLRLMEFVPPDVMYQFWHPGMVRMISRPSEDLMQVYSVVKDNQMTVELSVGIFALWETEDAAVPIEIVMAKLMQYYPMQIQTSYDVWRRCTQDQETIAKLGAYDFFKYCQNKKKTRYALPDAVYVGLDDFKLFLKFFGDPHRCLVKVLEAYCTRFFHRFLSSEMAKDKLMAAQEGSYLIRYSQSRLKDGFFTLDVNKKNKEGRLVVESYLLQYDNAVEKFFFDGLYFESFPEFVLHPKYHPHVLSRPIAFSQSLDGKDPKYQDDAALVSQLSELSVERGVPGMFFGHPPPPPPQAGI